MAKHLLLLWAAIGLLAAATTFAVWRGQSTQAHQNDALRSIMCRAEHVVKTQPGIQAKQRRNAIKFYKQALADAHLKPCP